MIPKPLAPAEDLRATPEDALVARARKQDEAAVRELIRPGGFEAVFPLDGPRCAGMADRVIGRLRRTGHPWRRLLHPVPLRNERCRGLTSWAVITLTSLAPVWLRGGAA